MITRIFAVLIACIMLPADLVAQPNKEEIVAFYQVLQALNLSLNGEDIHTPALPSEQIMQNYEDRLARMQSSLMHFREGSYARSYLACAIIGQQAVINYIKRDLRERS